jgi:hypothetical protein
MTDDKKALAAGSQIVGFRVGLDGRVDRLDEVEVNALVDCAIREAMDRALRARTVH